MNLTKEEVDKYYETISNGLLWPVFHSMPQKAEFEVANVAWGTYVAPLSKISHTLNIFYKR